MSHCIIRYIMICTVYRATTVLSLNCWAIITKSVCAWFKQCVFLFKYSMFKPALSLSPTWFLPFVYLLLNLSIILRCLEWSFNFIENLCTFILLLLLCTTRFRLAFKCQIFSLCIWYIRVCHRYLSVSLHPRCFLSSYLTYSSDYFFSYQL